MNSTPKCPSDRLWDPTSFLFNLPRGLPPEIKRLGCEAISLPQFSAEFRNQWSYIPAFPIRSHSEHRELTRFSKWIVIFFLFSYQYCVFFIIYNLTNDCTIISNTIITNNMLLHVSTFKMSSSGSALCLAKITYKISGLSIFFLYFNPLNTKRRLVYLNTQFVPRSKHFSSRL